MTAILFSRTIGPVPINVVMSEDHESEASATDNAVEDGSKITDHVHIEPKKLTLRIADANAAATYNALVQFQETRVPFTLVTGLYVYNSMVIVKLGAEREAGTSRILRGEVKLREIKIAETATSTDESEKKNDKTKASTSKEKAKDAATKDKVTGPTQRGDTPVKTVTSNQSILNKVFSPAPTGGGGGGGGGAQ